MVTVERDTGDRSAVGGISLYDISNPGAASPPQAYFNYFGETSKLLLASLGDNAIYTVAFNTVTKVDISDPAHPVILQIGTNLPGNSYPTKLLVKNDDFAYVTASELLLGEVIH